MAVPSASRSTGSSNSLGLYGAVSAEREGLRWRHKLNGRIDLRETNGVRTTQRALASWQPRFAVDPRAYIFGLSQYEHDRFLGLDDRYTLGAGAGYALFTGPKVRFDIEGGPALRISETTAGEEETTIAARASADFSWKISPTLELKQNGSLYVEEGNGTGRALTALDTRLLGGFRLRLSYELQYERNVARLLDRLDTTTRATVVYGF
jgi:putative salt-induced outer membrane protein